MRIEIRTAYMQVVKELIAEEEILRQCTVVMKDRNTLVISCETDNNYREIHIWTLDAIGCGLIHSAPIERL
jgi:hypothetical protein